jgi:hypothetical protein
LDLIENALIYGIFRLGKFILSKSIFVRFRAVKSPHLIPAFGGVGYGDPTPQNDLKTYAFICAFNALLLRAIKKGRWSTHRPSENLRNLA